MAIPILTKRSQFEHANQHGQRVPTKSIVLQFVSGVAPEAIHFGFTATRKLGGAVVRNRAKRRMRAAVQEILHTETTKKPLLQAGCHYVFIARQAILDRDFAALVKDMRYALHQTHDKKAHDKKEI